VLHCQHAAPTWLEATRNSDPANRVVHDFITVGLPAAHTMSFDNCGLESIRLETFGTAATTTTENNDENKTLHELLQKVKTLHPKKTTESNEEEPTTESQQYIYLMRKAKCPANDQRYYHLGHGNVALKELLQGKSIVEYPVVHVVPTENEDNYLKMHSIALFETRVAKETKNE
jgi:hypothetical protein